MSHAKLITALNRPGAYVSQVNTVPGVRRVFEMIPMGFSCPNCGVSSEGIRVSLNVPVEPIGCVYDGNLAVIYAVMPCTPELPDMSCSLFKLVYETGNDSLTITPEPMPEIPAWVTVLSQTADEILLNMPERLMELFYN